MVGYQAHSFTESLSSFLQVEAGVTLLPDTLLRKTFATYTRFSRTLPSLRGLPEESFKDTVLARPSTGSRPARFSTVLFVENVDVAETLSVQGYRVAQVRVIFTLPPSLQRLVVGPLRDQPHLAYVELFTPFTSPDPHSRLYKIGRAYSQRMRKAMIVPVAHIFRSCHLIPVFGSRAERSWTSDDVLETCDTFYLNPLSHVAIYRSAQYSIPRAFLSSTCFGEGDQSYTGDRAPKTRTSILAIAHRATTPPAPDSPPWPGSLTPKRESEADTTLPPLRARDGITGSPSTVEDSLALSEISAVSVQEESETESELDEERRKPFPTDPEPPAEEREPFSTPQSVRARRDSPPTRKRRLHEGGIPPAYDTMDPTLRFFAKRRRN
ncbi:hypothetical protein NUW54_g8175 [Trametes sanguinea]|uniref:Uncharacterized protein n=1 Tax=Trametes sanguinea TaxID=158606 RepID=A0ACC1PGH8_9APHY|nr:hypothetical protein NUW54_g8175 [Trametes sanguinea]